MKPHSQSGTKQQHINLDAWTKALGGELKYPTHFFFVPRQVIPKGEIVTDCRFVVGIRPNKAETYRLRLTVGGNLIQYPGDVSTRSAELKLTVYASLWLAI
jgi:hypothetical protein